MSALAFRPFSEFDWYGLAGAESFPDGSEPRIADLEVDGVPSAAVHDASGLTILIGDEALEARLPLEDDGEGPAGAEMIRDALALLSPAVSSIALRALGFRGEAGGPFEVRLEG